MVSSTVPMTFMACASSSLLFRISAIVAMCFTLENIVFKSEFVSNILPLHMKKNSKNFCDDDDDHDDDDDIHVA